MKKLLLLILLGNSALVAHAFKTFPADSLPKNDTIRISPYLRPATARSLGTFSFISNDPYAFQTNAGFSVLNTLRGHSPNLNIGPNYPNAAGGIRSGSSMLVIDGLPYASNFSNYYNLNAFEFDNVVALSNGNAASVYGGMASGGAFILESKNGKDVDNPTVEFNSSTSMSWYESQLLFPMQGVNEETIQQWRLTNAIAFMKDFGPVDTRVSYSYGFLPDGNTAIDTRTDNHNFKINTGAEIVRGLEARLILDYFTLKNSSTYNSATSTNQNKNISGNLLLTYKVLDWLTISSQSSLLNLNRRSEMSMAMSDQEQERKLANLFVSFNKPLGSRFGISAFSGVQYENNVEDRDARTSSSVANSTREYTTKSWSGGTGVRFMDALFLDFNYRRDYYSMLPSNDNSKPTYSISSSFNVLDIFHAATEVFSSARIRASHGLTHFAIQQGFPFSDDLVMQRPNEKKMNEVGIDLSFLKGRVMLNSTYFSNVENVSIAVGVPGGTGYDFTFINIGDLYVKGWEFVLAGTSIRRPNTLLETKLIWSTYKADIRASSEVEPNPDSQILGSSYPDWRGSIFNQFTFGKFFSTFLIEMQEGGLNATYDFSPGPMPALKFVDASQARLRDISIGYTLSKSGNSRQAQLSLSFRNIWMLYSKSDVDSESGVIPQKSVNLSLSLML